MAMKRVRKIAVFSVLMVLCAAAQVVISMPHHHHNSSEVPCYNFVHCLSDHHHTSSCGDVCSDATSDHTHAPKTDCGHLVVDIASQGREDSSPLSHFALAYVPLTVAIGSEDLLGAMWKQSTARIEHRANVGVLSPHVRYIASALPPRAPSV